MSHNEQKIGTAEPTIAGVITPNLGDVSDVNITSAQNNEVIAYSGGNWINTTAPIVSSHYIWIGEGAADDYDETGNTGAISSGEAWYIFDANEKNNISGATITKISGTDWIDYITLPAGNYVVDAQFYAVWSATGYIEVALYRSDSGTPTWNSLAANKMSHSGYIGDDLSANAISNIISGQFEVTAQNVTDGKNNFRLQIVAESNLDTYEQQGTIPSQYNYMHIRKVE